MATYKNEYSKKDDFALWLLHEIRHKMSKQNMGADELNCKARDVLKKYNLQGLKIKYS